MSASDALRLTLLFIYSTLLIQCAYTQDYSIQSRVIESETRAPIPYASVYTLKDRRGTITDLDGNFELTEVFDNDTIVFYFAGFQKKKLIAGSIGPTVKLEPLEQLLDDVIVLADESIPYKLISNTRKNVRHKNEVAQSYMEMQSFLNEHQLEYFQGYYYGTYDGYDIEDLELKTARFGIQKTPNMAFHSKETSRAMYKHDIFNTNEFFPDSPFGMKRRKLVKTFKVEMNAKYKEQNGDITYVLSFQPRKEARSAFSGKVWIDSATNILTKVELLIQDASKCPFIAIHRGGVLLDVNMHITKTYDRMSEGVRLNSMDFDFDFTFDPQSFYNVDNGVFYKQRPHDSINYKPIPSYRIRANAVLAAYNFNEEFYIPKFDFPSHEFADYHKMIAFKHHTDFWDCYTTFRVGNSEKNEQFLDDPQTVTHKTLFKKNSISGVGMYEYPYRHWAKKRIYLRPPAKNEEEKVPDIRTQFEGNSINAQKYNLVAQILFEVDSLCGNWQYRTRTVYDPFQSFYNFERTPRSVAFLNVYFDLMEISRRKLNAKLDAVENPSEEIWMKIYQKHKEKTSARMDTFFKEVERGTREEDFLKWNALVIEELGIDNIQMFSIPEEESAEE